jgi:hypothetical protein
VHAAEAWLTRHQLRLRALVTAGLAATSHGSQANPGTARTVAASRPGGSTYQDSQISPAQFRPHADAQITETVDMNPDPPAQRQASPDLAQPVPRVGESPTGYNPYTGGIQ